MVTRPTWFSVMVQVAVTPWISWRVTSTVRRAPSVPSTSRETVVPSSPWMAESMVSRLSDVMA